MTICLGRGRSTLLRSRTCAQAELTTSSSVCCGQWFSLFPLKKNSSTCMWEALACGSRIQPPASPASPVPQAGQGSLVTGFHP